MDFCPHCADWPLAADDAFCGGCGAFVAPVQVALVERPTSKGTSICLQLNSAGGPLSKIPFAVVVEGGSEIARARPGEFPEGLLLALPHGRDFGIRVHAVTGYSEPVHGRAPNSLAVAIAQRAAAPSQPSIHFAEASVDYGGARPVAPGWNAVPIELANAGPPVVLSGARLRVDGEPTGEDDPEERPAALPHLLDSGESAVFEAWMTESELQALVKSTRPRTGTVDITAHWLDGGIQKVTVAGRANLFRAREAAMKVELARRVRGRAGQRARIGALLTNTGGATLRVQGVEFVYGAVSLPVAIPLEWRQPLPPGAEAPAELRPLFPDEPGQDNVFLDVTAIAENSDEPIRSQDSRSAEATAADAVFRGWICIDFGTSETGAAALPQGAEQPLVIDLGRVPLRQRPEEQKDSDRLGRFLPTVVAEMKDGSFRTGGDAASLVRAEEMARKGQPWPADLERPRKLAAEFKWTLDDHQSDGGARGELLAAAYLKTVKELIENHPEIAASIGPSTRIVATRPTVFDDGRSERLVNAFLAAGFADPRVSLPSGERTLIAESWSPLPFVLQRSNLTLEEYERIMRPLDRGVTLSAFLAPHDPERAGASAWLLVCDVGAGSADFSVVEIVPERGRQLLRERDSHTDLDFVGRCFRTMAGEVLIDWALDQWEARGHPAVDREAFAMTVGASEDSAPEDRTAFEAATRALQFDPGLLSGGGFPALLQTAISQDGDDEKSVDRAIAEAFGPGGAARKSARAYLPLELRGPDGTISIDSDNLADLVRALIRRFLDRYRHPVERMIEDLVERSGLGAYLAERNHDNSARHVRIVPSGRGAAFVPAKALIRYAVDSLTARAASLGALSPVASKSITSWGGLKLAAAMENPMAEFRIDLGGRPLRPCVILSIDVNGVPRLLELPARDGGAVVGLQVVAQQHANIEEIGSLSVLTGPEDDAVAIEVPLPAGAAHNPDGWWLCGMRRGGKVDIQLVPAPTGEEALTALRLQEGNSS